MPSGADDAAVGTACTDPVLSRAWRRLHAGGMTETETKWVERIREWKASGKKAEDFAVGRGFKASTLRFWASRLRTPRKVAAPAAVEGEPRVRMARVMVGASLCVVVGAARIEIRQGFDKAVLRELVETLGGAA